MLLHLATIQNIDYTMSLVCIKLLPQPGSEFVALWGGEVEDVALKEEVFNLEELVNAKWRVLS